MSHHLTPMHNKMSVKNYPNIKFGVKVLLEIKINNIIKCDLILFILLSYAHNIRYGHSSESS